ncbi:MAG: amidohydrolase [Clostridia bacterium]|nr:amidohydrolase [Clostridia bacterium]
MSVFFRDILAVTPEWEQKVNIFVEKEKIAYIGGEEKAADIVVDGKNKMVIPGLVNTHSHAAMTMLRSAADALPLEKWLEDYVYPIEERLTPQAFYVGSMLGFAEMIQSGVTCVSDMYMNPRNVALSAIECGISLNISRGLTDAGCCSVEDNPRNRESQELFEEFHNYDNGRILVELAPHAIYACSVNYLEYIAKLAQKWSVGIHTHLSETQKEHSECIRKYSKTPAQVMHDAGIFKSRCVAAHGVYLTDNDLLLLKENNVSVVNCPESNLKLGSGICDVARLHNAGINVALGTDGAASNNNLNMIEEMHVGAILTNGFRCDASAIGPSFALRMATQNGADALGRPNTGRLEVGCYADLAVLDIDSLHFYPQRNMRSNLVYCAQGGDVVMTMARGKILYNNGEFTTIDIERIKSEFCTLFNLL